MAITQLQVEQFRNLQQLSITPSSTFNFIFGPNGSGKTSLLEAIFLLGRGKSFRTHQIDRLIAKGSGGFTVVGHIQHHQRQQVVGIRRQPRKTEIHLGGKQVSKMGDLAIELPTAVLEPGLHTIIEGGPENRRRFLDWGVFHVEPDFRHAWGRFRRVLLQRNAALKAGWQRKNIKQWDIELAAAAKTIDSLRRNYLSQLKVSAEDILCQFSGLNPISLDYYAGWPEQVDYLDFLETHYTADREKGYTQYGPHRADLSITSSKSPARDVLSRGQQKLCVASLILTQCAEVSKQGKQAVILVDDLAAELDESNRAAMLSILAKTGSQIFITGTDETHFSMIKSASRVFHVEQGAVRRISDN